VPEDGDADLRELLASSMDAPPELLPLMSELLRGQEELGARAVDVLELLATRTPPVLGEGSRVLDLGSGKGACALAIAEQLGARVLGIDGAATFVEHARAQAAERRLSSLCRFELDDLRARLDSERDHDLVMMLALGDVLGETQATVARLRQCVAPGGHVLIDGAYLRQDDDEDIDDELSALYPSHAETRAALESSGDLIVAEREVDGPDTAAHYRRATDAIAEHAQRLAQQHPALAEPLLSFAARQREAIETLAGPVIGCLWLLRRR